MSVKKYKVTKYIPSFMEGFKPETHSISKLKDIFDIGYLKKWRDSKNFIKFSIESNGIARRILMVYLNEGEEETYYVVSFVELK